MNLSPCITSQDDITSLQDSKQGVFPLISMWKTTRVNEKGMDTALYFNVQHSDKSYNYYLMPQESSKPESQISLTKICVTGLSEQELAELNFKYVHFSVNVGDVLDAGVGMDSEGDLINKSPKKPVPASGISQQVTSIKEISSGGRPDSGLGSLCSSIQEL